jgi:hypothetical protein
LISAQEKTLNFKGIVPQVSVENPFEIQVEEGWNLISNPYPFSMNWNAVLTKSNNTEAVLAPIGFDGTYEEKTMLQTFEGAYVFALEGTTLNIPVEHLDNARLEAPKTQPVFAGENWSLDFAINTADGKSFNLAGLGMHESAQEAYDSFDMPLLPRMPGYLDLQFPQKNILGIALMKDVVPQQENYTWDFSISSSRVNEEVTIQWKTQNAQKGMGLLLIDSETGEKVDMLKRNEYSFKINGSRSMQVEYVSLASNEPTNSLFNPFMGLPYPNPTVDKVNIPYSIPVGTHQYSIKLMDMSGREIAILEEGEKEEGNYLAIHDIGSLAQGVYYIVMEVPDNTKGRMTRKLIVR